MSYEQHDFQQENPVESEHVAKLFEASFDVQADKGLRRRSEQDCQLLKAILPELRLESSDAAVARTPLQRAQEQVAATLGDRFRNSEERDSGNYAVRALNHFCENSQLSEARRLQTVREIQNLLSPTEGSPTLSQMDRARLAVNVIDNITAPAVTVQQIGETCTVASLEIRIATLDPDRYANMIRQVATTGSYRCNDGTTIRFPPNSLTRIDGENGNHASRIFQVTAANIVWQNATALPDGTPVARGSLRYEHSADGECVRNYSRQGRVGEIVRDTNGREIDHPFLHSEQQHQINMSITGRNEIIQITAAWGDLQAQTGCFAYRSEEDLRRFLTDVANGTRRNIRFPLLISVDADVPPFSTRARTPPPPDVQPATVRGGGGPGAGAARPAPSESPGSVRGAGADSSSTGNRIERGAARSTNPQSNHVVSVVGFNPETGRVEIDNTWGFDRDHIGDNALRLSTLWGALPRPRR